MKTDQRIVRLKKTSEKWANAVLSEQPMRERLLLRPESVLAAYAESGASPHLLPSRMDLLAAAHMAGHITGAPTGLPTAARYAEARLRVTEAFVERGIGAAIQLPTAALCFSLQAVCGWQGAAQSVGSVLVRGLDTPLLDLVRNERHQAGELYRHLWFLLLLFADSIDHRIDVHRYSHPPDMAPYASTLRLWRAADSEDIQILVDEMCNYHLDQATNTKHDVVSEFDTEDVMVFPYEVLTLLRFRAWSGLENPEHWRHPLMNGSVARLPPQPLPIPDTPTLDAAVARFKIEFPGSFL